MGSNFRQRSVFERHNFIIRFISRVYSLFPINFLKVLLNYHRNTPGKIGYGIRYCLIKNIAESCGNNVAIDVGVFLINPEKISFGSNVSINPMSYLSAIGGLKIGSNVSIAHRVTIMTSTHNYNNLVTPIKYQGLALAPVVIADNVWIGAGVTILSGKKIGSGSIVGANSLVTKDIPNCQIWGGVPAKLLKVR